MSDAYRLPKGAVVASASLSSYEINDHMKTSDALPDYFERWSHYCLFAGCWAEAEVGGFCRGRGHEGAVLLERELPFWARAEFLWEPGLT